MLEKIFNKVYEKLHQNPDKYETSMVFLCNLSLNREQHNLLVDLFSEDFPKFSRHLDESYWGK